MASIAAAKPNTAILDTKAKMMSKKMPAKTHSLSLKNLFGVRSITTPDSLNTPSR